MIGLRKALVLSTLLLGAWSSPALAHSPRDDNSLINWDAFQSLLDTIDPAALHSVLHSLSPKFQDGVFSKDRAAIEHVHSENPIVASKLVHLAKKRQDSNSTTTASSTSSSSTSADSSSSSIEASISSELASAILASTVPAATTVTVPPAAPASATAIETTEGAVVFSTFGGGLVTLTSSAVGVSFSPSTSTHLFYVTAPDGTVRTSTSVVVINAPITDSPDATGAAGAASTGDSEPGLQNGSASLKMGGGVLTFAAIGGWLFFAL